MLFIKELVQGRFFDLCDHSYGEKFNHLSFLLLLQSGYQGF